MVYKYHCEGDFFICGDFNTRCGYTQDTKNSTAEIPNRLTIDHSSNAAGKLLLDFLESSDMCMLNGSLVTLVIGILPSPHLTCH